MKTIEFIAQGCSSVLGNFAAGDVARCEDALAAHLVNEAHAAVYRVEKSVAPAVDPPKPPETKSGKFKAR
jgi:hypothetical protein